MERKAGLIPDFASQFGEQLKNRNWGRLATYPAPANIAVVKEFYTNTRRLGDHPTEEYTSYVRGHIIGMEEGADFVDVESLLCVLGGNFQRNRNGVVVTRRADLTPLAKYLMAFSHANIQPCSHVSDITVSRALLLYCVLRGMSINIGQLVGVNISTLPFERPRKAIDEAYYRQYCGGDEAAQPIPPCHPRRGRGPPQAPAQPHDAEPFQMRDMYMSLIDARMQSIHKRQDQAHASGAGVAQAPTMDDDEDDFEDAEEEGEEEDSNDSRG
ncbi:hypothetical protein LR48_Vigan09g054800 [Vigna angularis]|uniref:Putative plant transposon protein domain-containing protein n=1 Tax=Phaseolus angularis TaxID=3914 RepID=A0A0L9VB60_PHAAN|nr:hypothetical protein LR48_Vigan09g054800 [Vigna angularis]